MPTAQALAKAEKQRTLDSLNKRRAVSALKELRAKNRAPVHPCTRVLRDEELKDLLTRMSCERSSQIYIDKFPESVQAITSKKMLICAHPPKPYRLKRPHRWSHEDVCDFLVSVDSVLLDWTTVKAIVYRENILGQVLVSMQPEDFVMLDLVADVEQAIDIVNVLQRNHLQPRVAPKTNMFCAMAEVSLDRVRQEMKRRNKVDWLSPTPEPESLSQFCSGRLSAGERESGPQSPLSPWQLLRETKTATCDLDSSTDDFQYLTLLEDLMNGLL